MADTPDRLIGGYATGNLTPEERRRLMLGAVEDQRVFDALVQEDALKESLEDRQFRAELLQVLGEPAAQKGWWAVWRSPRVLAAAAAVVLIAGLGLTGLYWQRTGRSADTASVSRPLEQWVLAAPISSPDTRRLDESMLAPEGAGPSFVADRSGRAAVFGITHAGVAVRLETWTPVTRGAAHSLPAAPASQFRELRIVIVDEGVAVERDEDVIAAVEAGRGVVIRRLVAPN